MEIKRSGTKPSGKGKEDYFTRSVRVDPMHTVPAPARVSMALVTFELRAGTVWHTHPVGQTLIVTSGCGQGQREGGPIEEIRPNDVAWSLPDEKHWCGANATTAMSHVAVQESLEQWGIEAYANLAVTSDTKLTPGIQLPFNPSFNLRTDFIAVPDVKFRISL